MQKKTLVIFIVILVAGLFGTMFGYFTREETALPAPVAQRQITVYVAGAVKNPSLVTLDFGARIAEAVNECGGVLPNADMDNVNMAEVLKDGQKVSIPTKTVLPAESAVGTAETVTSPATRSASKGKATNTTKGNNVTNGANPTKVNINTADEKELETLPGVGAATAKKIIEFRNEHGAFGKIEDIKKVRGIGDGKFAKMKDMITT